MKIIKNCIDNLMFRAAFLSIEVIGNLFNINDNIIHQYYRLHGTNVDNHEKSINQEYVFSPKFSIVL